MFLTKLSQEMAQIYDEKIERAEQVKISNGRQTLMIFIDDNLPIGILIDKKTGCLHHNTYSKKLVNEIIDALGGIEDIAAEKIMATMLVYEYAEHEKMFEKNKESEER